MPLVSMLHADVGEYWGVILFSYGSTVELAINAELVNTAQGYVPTSGDKRVHH